MTRCTCGAGPGVGAGHHEPTCGIDRETLEVAASLNAETVAGLQAHARAVEARCARLVASLQALLTALSEAEDNAESYVIPCSPTCRECTAGTSPANVDCPRHAAERLLKEIAK